MLASPRMGGLARHVVPFAALWTATLALGTPRAQVADPAAVPEPGVLVIEVSGVPSSGTLHLEIYDARRQERWGEPLRRERFAVEAGKAAEWRVAALPQGEYAVRVFLDQNGNGTLDRSRKGIPTEPFGFSNDAQRRYGVPRLKVAAFRFATAEQRVAIQLRGRSQETPAAAAPAPQPAAPDEP
jgi:uncharacterized protein (DUF2141 family)